jgi:Mrp family chromosome partitioning ATPase
MYFSIWLTIPQRNRIEGLPHVPASYDSYRDLQHPLTISDPERPLFICDTGTRTDLLHQIAEWVCDPDREQVYILAGIAGKGKSTVARTAAACAAQLGALGASFFFSRGENGLNTAKTFFSTIAYQLAHHRADFMDAIGDALASSPDASSKALHIQLDALILEPLRALCHNGADPTVIVIDALDECEKTESDTILRARY